jgi:hypothetical protein
MEIERRLLIVLSDYFLKQAQFNAVVNQTIKMDRVGVEATTSGLYRLCKSQMMKENLSAQIPSSLPFLFAYPLACIPSIEVLRRS